MLCVQPPLDGQHESRDNWKRPPSGSLSRKRPGGVGSCAGTEHCEWYLEDGGGERRR